MHNGQASDSTTNTCQEQHQPSLDLFYQQIQHQKEQHLATLEAKFPQAATQQPARACMLKLLTGLVRLQARRTVCYHFPPPLVAHINHLVDVAPADPAHAQWPSSPVWIQFDEPIRIGLQEEAIAALYFIPVYEPAIPVLLRETYKGLPTRLEQDAQLSFAEGLGHWHLEFITLTPEGEAKLLREAVLCYDATLSQWAYPSDRHLCAECIGVVGEHGEDLILECLDCQAKRKARSTWFATALALLQRKDPPAGELQQSEELFTAPPSFKSRVYIPRQKSLVTLTPSAHPPETQGAEAGDGHDDAALLPPPSSGVYRHPKTGRYQVWVAADFATLQWVTVHHHRVSAERLSAIIGERREELRNPTAFHSILRRLARDSEGTPARVSAQAEWNILERCRISSQQPDFEPSLRYFSQFFQAVQQVGNHQQHSISLTPCPTLQPWLERIQATHYARCAEVMSITFADASALKLCEAMLSASGYEPAFPGQPLWIQPLARLWFRGKLVRGVCITPFSLRPPFEQEAARRKLSAQEKEQAWQQIASLEGCWHIAMVVDAHFTKDWTSPKDIAPGNLSCYSFACYTANGQWTLTARATETCPSGRCLCEMLGTQPTVIPCQACRAELEDWMRWLKTWFWVMCGKFRKADDTRPFETTMLTLPVESKATPERAKTTADKPRTYRVTTISFDASYFLPEAPPSRKTGALKDQYLVLTVEEALAEGAIEVDLDGVLIRDFGAVRGYHRRRPGRQEKQYIEPKDRRAQYISLRRWKARRWGDERHVTDVIASENVRCGG